MNYKLIWLGTKWTKFKVQVTPNNTARKKGFCGVSWRRWWLPKSDRSRKKMWLWSAPKVTLWLVLLPRSYRCKNGDHLPIPKCLDEIQRSLLGRVEIILQYLSVQSTRKVCIHRYRDCYERSGYIQVKYCGAHYIYNLNYLGFCNTRYYSIWDTPLLCILSWGVFFDNLGT